MEQKTGLRKTSDSVQKVLQKKRVMVSGWESSKQPTNDANHDPKEDYAETKRD
jgi:hypothetical protein